MEAFPSVTNNNKGLKDRRPGDGGHLPTGEGRELVKKPLQRNDREPMTKITPPRGTTGKAIQDLFCPGRTDKSNPEGGGPNGRGRTCDA